jgi:chorismate-pyruvate lyase
MHSLDVSALQRQRFLHPFHPMACKRVLQLLLAQDGSTTRLCETIAGGPVEFHLLEQRVVGTVPSVVQGALPGAQFIERITCLAAHGQVLMDNLAYIALDGLQADVRMDLEAGVLPIGPMLARLWVRRCFLDLDTGLLERLWSAAGGQPDLDASRMYCIVTAEGPRMLIAETFRRGMLMNTPEEH